MSLNKSKGNMYDFVTHTWNAIKGECPHGCSYCYMKRWGKQKPVRLDLSEMKTDLGSGNFIFVGSSCDMFASGIPGGWINDTLRHCNLFDNRYLFQTKNPVGFSAFLQRMPEDTTICTTIETNRWIPEVMMDSPGSSSRAGAMAALSVLGLKTFVTIEPVMDFDLKEMLELIKMCKPVQVNIGADSGGNHLPEPSAKKLRDLIAGLEEFTTIHSKRNLGRLLK